MGTVDKAFADELVKCEGKYKDDPQIYRIVEYDNAWGGRGYGLEYANNLGTYSPSPYVQNPRVYWEFKKEEV